MGTSRAASYRELAIIAITFAAAQNNGPKYWIQVKNLVGAEAICAALGTTFLAEVTIRSINTINSCAPRVPADPPIHKSDGVNVVSKNLTQHVESTLSMTTPTSIHFEYDTSGEVTIGICEAGAPICYYIIPEGGLGRPSRNSLLGGEILTLARIVMGHKSLWVCRGAIGAYSMRRLAMEVVEELQMYQKGTCQAMSVNLVGKWMHF